MQSSIFAEDYKPSFTGHETFHLRYGWLRKAFCAVQHAKAEGADARRVFGDDTAIARFGVGKNMVASIRFWANACKIIKISGNDIAPTEFGDFLFGTDGVDPYLEYPSSLWAIHWNLATNLDRTTFFWAFNHLNDNVFDKDRIIRGIIDVGGKLRWSRLNKNTIGTDASVLINTYAVTQSSKKGFQEDSLVSPLCELGLIRSISNNRFRFGWGRKSNLSDGVFLYSLLDFWLRFTSAKTLSFQAIMLEPGSPGRVFLMDESDLAGRLESIQERSRGILSWSETAGLKQLILNRDPTDKDLLSFLTSDFPKSAKTKAA